MRENEIIKLCQKGNFKRAIEEIDNLILSNHPTSNLYRLKGQARLELGQIDDSINDLIESLKLDSNNIEALTLIGNIYGRDKRDIITAIKYYNKVLELRPNDFLAISNIASVYAMNDDFIVAEELYGKALRLNPNFPNALYGKSMVLYNKGKYNLAFNETIKCLRATRPINKEQKEIISNAQSLAEQCCKSIVTNESPIFAKSSLYLELKKLTDKPIKVEVDNSISTLAKIEIAEYKNKSEHFIKYKSETPLAYHLFHHELLHLKYIIEAREEEGNELFTSTEINLKNFKNNYKGIEKNLVKKGLPNSYATNLYRQLFDGLNSQLFNAPIDLFIEHEIYEKHEEVRPYQFLSIIQIINTVLQGAYSSELKGLIPKT